jgi:hypothetical protein
MPVCAASFDGFHHWIFQMHLTSKCGLVFTLLLAGCVSNKGTSPSDAYRATSSSRNSEASQPRGDVRSRSPESASPTLKRAWIQFHTGKDDKDSDTALAVWLRTGDTQLASLDGFGNHEKFAERSDSSKFELGHVDTSVKKSTVGDCVTTRIKMTTKDGGDDNWWFRFTVTLEWSDGSQTSIYHPVDERYDDDERVDAEFTDCKR